jgi:hypothetical protein
MIYQSEVGQKAIAFLLEMSEGYVRRLDPVFL